MKRIAILFLITLLVFMNFNVVSAMSLNYKKLYVTTDDYEVHTIKLKVKGAKKKVRWSVNSNKKRISVKNGKLHINKKGKYTVTAKVGKKKLKCRIKVVRYVTFHRKLFFKSYKPLEKLEDGIVFSEDILGWIKYNRWGIPDDKMPVCELTNVNQTIKNLKKMRKNKHAKLIPKVYGFKKGYIKLCKQSKKMESLVRKLPNANKQNGEYYNILAQVTKAYWKLDKILDEDIGESIDGNNDGEWIGIQKEIGWYEYE